MTIFFMKLKYSNKGYEEIKYYIKSNWASDVWDVDDENCKNIAVVFGHRLRDTTYINLRIRIGTFNENFYEMNLSNCTTLVSCIMWYQNVYQVNINSRLPLIQLWIWNSFYFVCSLFVKTTFYWTNMVLLIGSNILKLIVQFYLRKFQHH